MLSHVLDNIPRVGYAHQSDLIGPATQTVRRDLRLRLHHPGPCSATCKTSTTAGTTPTGSALPPQMTDITEAQVLAEQSAWATADSGGNYTATEPTARHRHQQRHGGQRPDHRAVGTTVAGAAFGRPTAATCPTG